MAKKVIKVNSNPSSKTNIKTSSPTTDAVREWSEDNRARERYYGLEKESTKSIYKINSNPVPGKTVIGPLAKGVASGGVAGLALGAVAAYKAELKAAAEAKKIKNRMN